MIVQGTLVKVDKTDCIYLAAGGNYSFSRETVWAIKNGKAGVPYSGSSMQTSGPEPPDEMEFSEEDLLKGKKVDPPPEDAPFTPR